MNRGERLGNQEVSSCTPQERRNEVEVEQGYRQRYGTTYTAIMNLNGLKSTFIKVGQQLQVGGTTSSTASTTNTSSTTYTVKSGDTLSGIAKQYRKLGWWSNILPFRFK